MNNVPAFRFFVPVAVILFCGFLAPHISKAADGKPSPTPCAGMVQSLNESNKTNLEKAIVRQINSSKKQNISSVNVVRSFVNGDWRVVFAVPHKAEDVFLFYNGDPVTTSYVAFWSGAVPMNEEPVMKAWALKSAPGIPPALAGCFAWYLAKGPVE